MALGTPGEGRGGAKKAGTLNAVEQPGGGGVSGVRRCAAQVWGAPGASRRSASN